MAMQDSSYTPSTNEFESTDKTLHYTPKRWENSELIERVEMNNIEQGIQIALESRDNMMNIKQEFLNQITGMLNDFNTRADQIDQTIANYKTDIENSVETQLEEQSSDVLSAFNTLLGTYYALENLTDNLAQDKQNVHTRITELYNTIFSNGENNIAQLQNNLANLNTYVRGE